jgi:hypothetical protein
MPPEHATNNSYTSSPQISHATSSDNTGSARKVPHVTKVLLKNPLLQLNIAAISNNKTSISINRTYNVQHNKHVVASSQQVHHD